MSADFLDAFERHWHDAELLLTSARWANADHLYGIAAECGLKQLMLKFGMGYDMVGDKPDNRDDRVHADGIWSRFEHYRSGHVGGASYVLPSANPFHNWKISDRYAHQDNFDEQRARNHRLGAVCVQQLLQQARRDGLLP